MTPAARLSAVIELLEATFEATAPAHQVLAGYLRGRRYIGSGDRRAISEIFWDVLRHNARLHWWLGQAGDLAPSARTLVLAYVVDFGGESVPGVEAFDGSAHGPEPLSDDEQKALNLAKTGIPAPPPALAAECPEWLWPSFEAAFGAHVTTELEALNTEAPVDIRVNTLKTNREGVIKSLAKQGIEAASTPLSPVGLRLDGRTRLGGLKSFEDGLFEVQDEASQLAALLVDAAPGTSVCDLCAGAGGKTLAIAAVQEGKGRLVACDIEAERLDRAKPRFARAGVHNAETQALGDLTDPWIKKNKQKFDRVVIDAPCSATGTWRRHPEDRWRLDPEVLDDLTAAQEALLATGARLVKPGGRLIYITCSVLPEENEALLEAFGHTHPDFVPVDLTDAFTRLTGKAPAVVDDAPWLRLTPARAGTDGFSIAVLEYIPKG